MSKDELIKVINQIKPKVKAKVGEIEDSGTTPKSNNSEKKSKKSVKSKGNAGVIVHGDVHGTINLRANEPSEEYRPSEQAVREKVNSTIPNSRYEQLKCQQLESEAENKRILMVYIARHMKVRQFCVVAVVLSIASFVISSLFDSNTVSMYSMGAFVISTLKMTANELGLSTCQKKIKSNCFYRPGDEFNESLSPDENDQGFGPIDRFKKS